MRGACDPRGRLECSRPAGVVKAASTIAAMMVCFLRTMLVAAALLAASAHAETVRMATTTSTANTGLLDYLLPKFRGRTGITEQYFAVGTRAARKTREQVDPDLVLVHDRESDDR